MLSEFNNNLKVISLGLLALGALWNPASIWELQRLWAIHCCRPLLGFKNYHGWLIFLHIFKGYTTSQTFSFRIKTPRNMNSNFLTLIKVHRHGQSKTRFSLLNWNHCENTLRAFCLTADVFHIKDDISSVITLLCLPTTCVVPKLIWHW